MRENNLDLLRVISCLLVIILHVGGVYGQNISSEYPSYYFTLGNFLHSMTRTAVPTFIILSGAFLLENIKNLDYRYHYKKTFNRVILPTLIFSVLYVIYSMIITKVQNMVTGSSISYSASIISWILGRPFYHMWYMYMIIGCYAITPWLIKLRLSIGNKSFEKLGWIFILIGIGIYFFKIKLIWPIQFIQYLGYFILGYTIKKSNKKIENQFLSYLMKSISVLFIMFLFTEFNIRYSLLNDKFLLLEPLSPLAILSSIFLYRAFLNLNVTSSFLLKFSKHTFNIYILHAGILFFLDLFTRKLLNPYPNPLWYFPVLILAVFILSYIGSLIINKSLRSFNALKVKIGDY